MSTLRYLTVFAAGILCGLLVGNIPLTSTSHDSARDTPQIQSVEAPTENQSINSLISLDAKLETLQQTLVQLQMQNAHLLESFEKNSHQKADPEKPTGVSETPGISPALERGEFENLHQSVREQVVTGKWDVAQRNQLARHIPLMSEEQKREVLTELIHAINRGELEIDPTIGLF